MIKFGRRNQIYGRWKRLLLNPDNPNELYLVIEKDEPMSRKYIRQFENMFAGKEVILTIGILIRGKREEEKIEAVKTLGKERRKTSQSPFWDAPEEEWDYDKI